MTQRIIRYGNFPDPSSSVPVLRILMNIHARSDNQTFYNCTCVSSNIVFPYFLQLQLSLRHEHQCWWCWSTNCAVCTTCQRDVYWRSAAAEHTLIINQEDSVDKTLLHTLPQSRLSSGHVTHPVRDFLILTSVAITVLITTIIIFILTATIITNTIIKNRATMIARSVLRLATNQAGRGSNSGEGECSAPVQTSPGVYKATSIISSWSLSLG
jgi:hypothetical protein